MLRELFVVALVIVGLFAIIAPAIRAAREASRRHECANHLKSVALALQAYHDNCRGLPPSRFANDDGAPLHSWRSMIMPYLEAGPFYHIYSFDEPWDGPLNNRIVIGDPVTYPEKHGGITTAVFARPATYHCPSATQRPADRTSQVVITGPGTIFPADNVGLKFADITDGLSNTLLVGEMDPPTIHWLEPRDLEFAKLPLQINSRSRPCLSSGHPGGVNAAMADGSVHFLSNEMAPNQVRTLLLIDDATMAKP